ncbi:MAG: S41 family peptidase [Vicingaceae bacterium]
MDMDKKVSKLLTYSTLILSFIIMGCEKMFIQPKYTDTPTENFEILWKELDEKYSFFIYKNIDWKTIYNQYKPMVNDNMSDEELFEVMNQMLFHLKDGHVNLTAPFNTTRYWEFFLNAPANFNYDVILRNYFNNQHKITEYGNFQYIKLGDIGYVYIPSFSGANFNYFSYVIDEFKNCKAIIVDIRNNGGGDPINAETIAKFFCPSKRIYAYWQWKNGPGHNDFTAPIPYFIESSSNPYTKPVALLTNRSTFSAANDFTLMMKQLEQVTIIGDTTGGGGGVPYKKELPNGWTYRFSRTLTLDPQMNNVEFGIAPDIVQYMDSNDINNGKDAIIEKALQILN